MAEFKVTFAREHADFDVLLGDSGQIQDVCILADTSSSSGLALYHEAGIYHPPTRSVFVTSNQLPNSPSTPNAATSNKHVKLFRFYDDDEDGKVEEVHFPGFEGAMLNGGVNYDQDTLLLCAQGSKDPRDLSGLIKLPIPTPSNPTPAPETIVDSFHGIPFNSVNDVIVHPADRSIWFTDPHYGFHQGIRPQPQLPNQVYRYDPKTRAVRAVADGFTRPNGLCFSPDLKLLYVTDTGAIHGSSSVPIDPAGPSHIYVYDIVYPEAQKSEPFLANKRLFAYAPGRFPDGIKCDTRGNVYSGCGDGIEVWNPSGVLIGTIKIPGGTANFCFGEDGVIYAFNETRMVRIKLKGKSVQGCLVQQLWGPEGAKST